MKIYSIIRNCPSLTSSFVTFEPIQQILGISQAEKIIIKHDKMVFNGQFIGKSGDYDGGKQCFAGACIKHLLFYRPLFNPPPLQCPHIDRRYPSEGNNDPLSTLNWGYWAKIATLAGWNRSLDVYLHARNPSQQHLLCKHKMNRSALTFATTGKRSAIEKTLNVLQYYDNYGLCIEWPRVSVLSVRRGR